MRTYRNDYVEKCKKLHFFEYWSCVAKIQLLFRQKGDSCSIYLLKVSQMLYLSC